MLISGVLGQRSTSEKKNVYGKKLISNVDKLIEKSTKRTHSYNLISVEHGNLFVLTIICQQTRKFETVKVSTAKESRLLNVRTSMDSKLIWRGKFKN